MMPRFAAFSERKANTNANIIAYLKKRAEMTADFNDEKVAAALSKIVVPDPDFSKTGAAGCDGFDCIVPNKMFRNWIDLIPERDRGYVRFVYTDGGGGRVEKYLKTAMTEFAFANFKARVSEPANDGDLFLMRWLIWHAVVLKQAVGFDFGNYEMNAIFNSLPLDISKDRKKFGRRVDFAEFYKMIWFAEKGLCS
jgi:hypothetical protein